MRFACAGRLSAPGPTEDSSMNRIRKGILALTLAIFTAGHLAGAPAAPQKPAKPKTASGTPAAAAAKPSRVTSVEGITEYRLGNGLRVLLFPDPTKPTITVNVTYMVG